MTRSKANQTKLFNAVEKHWPRSLWHTLVYLWISVLMTHRITTLRIWSSVSMKKIFLKIWKENRFNLLTKKLSRNVLYRSQRRVLIPLPKDYRDYFFSPYQKSHLITGKVTMYLLGDLWKKKKKNRNNSILCYF